jgi:CheY-like chemotaxis protein
MTRDPRVRMSPQRFDNVPPLRPDEVTASPVVFQLVERMMSLDPQMRYQTPGQLLEAVRSARRDLDAPVAELVSKPTTRSVFVVQKDERLQDAMRDKFKELGYRVFLAADPARAMDRFRQQPFDALVLDAGTTGEEGRLVFEHIMSEAERQALCCAGILILSPEQSDWVQKLSGHARTAVLVRPITLKQVRLKLQHLVPLAAKPSNNQLQKPLRDSSTAGQTP